jgi:hypothetical protein
MALDQTLHNPLNDIQVGSFVTSEPGELGRFQNSVVNKPITKIVAQAREWKSMSGESSYVNSSRMNQASFSVSGSYGVSGLSKVSAAVSGYVGNSSAQSTKNVSANYQVLVVGGLEHIDFDNLKPSQLMAALDGGVQERLNNALDAYNAINDALPEGQTLLDILRDPKTNHEDELFEKFQHWIEKINRFQADYGDGIVVAVAWGGVGVVNLTLSHKSNASTWKYGGEASFSYAGVGASVSLGAAYDGSQDHQGAEVKVDVDEFSSGTCVQADTDEWYKTLASKAFSELADANILADAPAMAPKAVIKEAPAFVPPKEDKGVADKVGKITSLKGLKAYALAAAYDKAKKADKNLSLDDFLAKRENKTDTTKVSELKDAIANNNLPAVAAAPKKSSPIVPHAFAAQVAKNGLGQAHTTTPFSGYTPIAVWVANWDQLFPWLATGYLNAVGDLNGATTILQGRRMLQDFLALSKLYYMADNCKFDPSIGGKFEWLQIAQNFAHACATLQNGLKASSISNAVSEAMSIARGELSTAAAVIYGVWEANPFLRSAELGLGLIEKSQSLAIKGSGREIHPGYWPECWDVYFTSPSYFSSPAQKCLFEEKSENKNYSSFASFYKLLPLIRPDGKILAFGPGNGVLSSGKMTVAYSPLDRVIGLEYPLGRPENGRYFFAKESPPYHIDGAVVWNSDRPNCRLAISLQAIEFTPNPDEKVLENKERGIKLYPIPFSAAQGITWQGQSFSTNLASMGDLKAQLDQLQEQLTKLPAWSLTSDDWDEDSLGDKYYSSTRIRKQYLGLVDESFFPTMQAKLQAPEQK